MFDKIPVCKYSFVSPEIESTKMAVCSTVLISFLLILPNLAFISAKLTLADAVAQQQERVVLYSNTWVVKVAGGTEEADALASKHGLINRGQVIIIKSL